MEAQSVGDTVRSAEEAAYEARESIRAKVEALEAEAAELAKAGDYAAAIAKYEEGEKGRVAYERLANNHAIDAIIRRFPNLSAMPTEYAEVGIAADRLPGAKVERRDGSGVSIPVFSVRAALVAIATKPKGGLFRNWNQHTHAFCEDGCDLRSDVGY